MSMNNVNTNVSGVARPSQVSSTQSKPNVSSASSFQPKTEVNIENSVQSTLNVLTKTILDKMDVKQELPPALQKMMNEILQSSFSLESSVSQGLSDTIQSQKVCLEQLTILAKFLEQLGVEFTQSSIEKLPEIFKTLFANLNLNGKENGIEINATNLNKIALQLLEGKEFNQLPQEIQLLLLNNFSLVQAPIQKSPETDILQQLIKFFIPSAKSENSGAEVAEKSIANEQDPTKQGQAQDKDLSKNEVKEKNNSEVLDAKKNANETVTNSSKDTPNVKQENLANSAKGQVLTEKNLGEGLAKGTKNTEQLGKQNINENLEIGQKNSQNANAVNSNLANQINSKDIQALLKNLSMQLLNSNKELSEEDVTLLKNFINDKQSVLSEKDVATLKTLLTMAEENIPFSIRQAAVKENLPGLPKLWAFVQLTNLTKLLDLNQNKLQNAGKNILDFCNGLKKALESEVEVSGNQKSMSFMSPIYLGDNEHQYPAYIHIYHQEAEEKNNKKQEAETWLRICLITENIGAVEVIFRLYEGDKLNLRLAFSNEESVNSFSEFIPELETAFKKLPFTLTDVKVNEIGEKQYG